MTEMKKYRSHKTVLAKPMTRGEYNTLRNWELPADEDGADQGYLVEYPGGGAPNHPDFKNYISWSPKDVFERGNTSVEPGDTGGFPDESLQDFLQKFMPWWENRQAQLEHLTTIPEGTDLILDDESVKLEGEFHKGFVGGVMVAIMTLGHLPFAVQYSEPEPKESDAPTA